MDMLLELGELNIHKLIRKCMAKYLKSIGFNYPEKGEMYRLVTEDFEATVKVEHVYSTSQFPEGELNIRVDVQDIQDVDGYSFIMWLGTSGRSYVNRYNRFIKVLDLKKVEGLENE